MDNHSGKHALKLLCISNGHGEDAIAVRILKALRALPGAPDCAALPMVGTGESFHKAGIPSIGPAQAMPSGGFIYMDSRQLARDVQSGLVQLTLAQIRAVKTWAAEGGWVFAVGDGVPLAIAWLSGASYCFLGTAKSEYWLRDETGPLPEVSPLAGWSGSVYLPWERWLMSRPRCRQVFVRDALTAESLQRFGIPAIHGGNPMMDDLEPSPERLARLTAGLPPAPEALSLVLLPGSRSPEAEHNWRGILQAVASVGQVCSDRPLRLWAAIAPALPLAPFHQALLDQGWHPLADDPYPTYQTANAILRIAQDAFAECLQVGMGAIATAGTATEQVVGLGKPAFTFPGPGPQFTRAFAQTQARLLGRSVIRLEAPIQVGAALQSLWQEPGALAAIAANGQHRMGQAGAAHQIATHLHHLCQKSPA